MKNFVFDLLTLNETEEDVWIIFKSEEELDKYYSLSELLFDIDYNPSKLAKTYELKHSTFYEMLSRSDGMKQLALLMTRISRFLKAFVDIGAIYGNLRTENILIKLSRKNTIENVKFLRSAKVTEID